MKPITDKTLNELAETGHKWAVVAVDETFYWDKEVIKKAERIEGVYLVNLGEPTHCCSLSVDFPALCLRNFIQNGEAFDKEELWKLEMEDTLNEWKYLSSNSVFKCVNLHESGDEEDIIEQEAANPSYC
jgi:hypothetical protein